MKRLFPILFLLLVHNVQAEILKVTIDGIIDPITSEFIQGSVVEAEKAEAEFLLIELATPGGLGVSMQEIIQTILNSKVPIVCHVTPKGSHAASAGFFILLSADLAVMSPGTNTGSAHPVLPFGMENKIMVEKVKNDALANLRAIVKQRKRNYELAEKGVLESKSYTAEEALEGGLIDLIADGQEDLFERLNGLEITRFTGEKQILKTEGQTVRTLEMTLRQEILSTIAEPNFALLLGLIGLLGLYLEFNAPGFILPGVVGGICLLLSLLGFSLLPVSLIGVLLILLALGLFVAEVKVQGFGVLGMGGIVALALGLIFLIDAPYPALRIDLGLALAVALSFGLIFVFLARLAVQSFRSRVTTGSSGIVGMIGTVRSEIPAQSEGKVFVNGELWRATADHPIPVGTRVRVVEARNLDLRVETISDEEAQRNRFQRADGAES